MKDKLYVNVTAEKIYKRKFRTRIAIIAILVLLLFLSIIYAILYVVNSGGNFTINLDPNLKADRNIVLSSYRDFHETTLKLTASSLEYMDNIAEEWLPDDIDEKEGSHNGEDYIAYTFFVKNDGDDVVNYYTSIDIESVIKNVDEAVRVAVYLNGEKTVYAKRDSSGSVVEGTKPFSSNTQVMNMVRKEFKPDDVDRFTVVIWLEGNDPECIDDILGGEMKMIMMITENHR